ncbi:MAG: DUF1846 domain-containing protein [Clostridia bacterium]|nr:DUF1846 domain-containing protein [Clostridia bacterium]MBQ6324686.1 DUF1846 domain-containing protein [Clostridia bacterium]
MNKIGFDSQKYIRLQSARIRERIEYFGGKLYLEFGGKLFDDYHASRVLPGFAPDNKIRMLLELKDQAEIVIAINANDIEKSKVRGDLGITYDSDVIRLVDVFREFGLFVGSIAITQYTGQSAADVFQRRLEGMGLNVYRLYRIPDYPANVAGIVSEEGYGKNEYIRTSRSLVVVTAPGPGSGKMATCLSQLYHEHKRGIQAGYAKFETFPIWNLPLKHPVNLAYEAATADLNDVNMIDPFHLEAYGETTVNYNRDIEIFPVLRAIFEKIYGECPYKSPTDMGVNMAGKSIVDDAVCREASCQEIIRRYYKTACAVKQGRATPQEVQKIELLMRQLNLDASRRSTVQPALDLAEQTGEPAVAIELNDGKIITGKTTTLLGAASAALLNALKDLAGIPDEIKLISPNVIEPIQHLKVAHMGNRNPLMHIDEILIALTICAVTDDNAEQAMEQLSKLSGCEAHSTVILSQADEGMLSRLGLNLTCEPAYQTNKLYHK